MKLPGINYNLGVQSLGRADTSAPGRQWAANQQVRDATTDIAEAALRGSLDAKAYDEREVEKAKYEAEKAAEKAEREAEKQGRIEATAAMNNYNKRMSEFGTYAKWTDQTNEKGVSTIQAGVANYTEFERKVREETVNTIPSEYGKRDFNIEADRANVQYGAQWGKQLVSWKQGEDTANGLVYVNDAVMRHDYPAAYNKIERMNDDGLLTPTAYASMRLDTAGRQKDYEYNTSITEIGDTHDAASRVQAANAKKAEILNDPILNNDAAEKYISIIENKIIAQNADQFRTFLAEMSRAKYPPEVIDGVKDDYIKAVAMITDDSVDGLSENSRADHVRALKVVAQDWDVAKVAKAASAANFDALTAYSRGAVSPTSGDNSVGDKAQDIYARVAFLHQDIDEEGKINEYSGLNVQQLFSPNSGDPDITYKAGQARRAIIEDYQRTGSIPKSIKTYINSGLTSNDRQTVFNTVNFVRQLGNGAFGSASYQQLSITDVEKQIIATFDTATAADLIIQNKKVSQTDRNIYQKQFTDSVLTVDTIRSAVKAYDPAVSAYVDDPDWEGVPLDTIKRHAAEFVGFTGGNVEMAVTMAYKKLNYGVDLTFDKVMRNPFSKTVAHAEQDDGWVHRQLREDITAQGYALPDDYDYMMLDIPHKKAKEGSPAFSIKWINERGEEKSMIFVPDFDATPEGIKYKADADIKMLNNSVNARTAKQAAAIERGDAEAGNILTDDATQAYVSMKMGETASAMVRGSIFIKDQFSDLVEDVVNMRAIMPQDYKRLKDAERKRRDTKTLLPPKD